MRVYPRKKGHLHPDEVRAAIAGCLEYAHDTCPFRGRGHCTNALLEAAGNALDDDDGTIHLMIRRLNRAIDTIHRLKKFAGQTCIGCKYEDEWNRDLCTSCPYNNGNNWTCKEEKV